MKLNSFKHECCGVAEEKGKAPIGKGYWSGFMKRKRNRLNSLRPQKFGLDRNTWCKYAAFYDMYDSIEMVLIEAKFMRMLEEPECQDKDCNRV